MPRYRVKYGNVRFDGQTYAAGEIVELPKSDAERIASLEEIVEDAELGEDEAVTSTPAETPAANRRKKTPQKKGGA